MSTGSGSSTGWGASLPFSLETTTDVWIGALLWCAGEMIVTSVLVKAEANVGVRSQAEIVAHVVAGKLVSGLGVRGTVVQFQWLCTDSPPCPHDRGIAFFACLLGLEPKLTCRV